MLVFRCWSEGDTASDAEFRDSDGSRGGVRDFYCASLPEDIFLKSYANHSLLPDHLIYLRSHGKGSYKACFYRLVDMQWFAVT